MTTRAKLGVIDVFACSFLILMLFVGFTHGNLQELLKELVIFVSGGAKLIVAKNLSVFSDILVLLGIAAFSVLLSVIICKLTNLLIGKAESILLDHFKEQGIIVACAGILITVVIEELAMRWLFLGVFTKISFLSGTGAFYALLVASNILFALAHRGNVKNKKQRNVLRTFSQFASGIILSFVFVKFGLFIAICVHLLHNTFIIVFYLPYEMIRQQTKLTLLPQMKSRG
ncbi:CPBP family intramembrane metalloprotease [Patescibacteria group bacterium]|nr:CPBP family intramembrane metalloprotease [Patescibacteria group bacterium]